MNKEEIGKYIAKLFYTLDIENNRINRVNDFITRLKDNDQKAYNGREYEKIKERDKYLKEEIDIFLLNIKGM